MTSERITAEPERTRQARGGKGGNTEIPRRKNSNGTEGGPYIIPPGAQHIPGKWVCETCGRNVKTDNSHPRKGSCKCLYYKRTTTFIDVLQDEYNLKQWGKRNVAWGMAQRPDLVLHATSCKPDVDRDQPIEDKRELNNIAAEASSTAGDMSKARIGTSLHKLTHQMDRGDTLGFVPDPYPGDLKAYDTEMKRLGVEWVSIEAFRVFDQWVADHVHGRGCGCLGVAGTVDRIGWMRGRLRIFDIKGLALTTPLPTPTGWTTMGAVQVGDQVLGANGKPCTVTLKSDTKRIGTYIVSFDDGAQVVCDSEHIWWTQDWYDTRHGLGPRQRTVQQLRDSLTHNGQSQHRVPMPEPLQLPEIRLPINPYVLGAWLGDGSSNRGEICKADDLFNIFEAEDVSMGKRQVDKRTGCVTRTVAGLTKTLRNWDLLGNKHIPARYLRASHNQRLALLQGLMDTDGTWNTARRRAQFTNTNKALALAVEELLLTLGQKPHFSSVQRTGFGKTVTAYDVEFLPVDIEPFRLPRKAAKAVAQKPVNPTKAGRRMITSIEPGPDVETACIAVDSDNHVYLCGDRMIPTHNTGSDYNKLGHAMQLAMYAHMIPYLYPGDTRSEDVDQVDLDVGYIIKLPEGQGHCEVEPMNLQRGWAACLIAKQVWEARAWKVDVERDHHAEVTEMALRATSVEECRLLWENALDLGVLDNRVKTVIRARAAELKRMVTT